MLSLIAAGRLVTFLYYAEVRDCHMNSYHRNYCPAEGRGEIEGKKERECERTMILEGHWSVPHFEIYHVDAVIILVLFCRTI